MKNPAFEILLKKHRTLRLMLLAALVLYMLALFAVISKWSYPYLYVAAACLFHLVVLGAFRRSYRSAYTRAYALSAAANHLADAVYEKTVTVSSDLLAEKGFVPDVAFLPNAQLHHVLRGKLSGHPAMIAETALVRLGGSRRSIAGTLLTVDNAAPEDESWVLLWNDPLDGIVDKDEFYKNGWHEAALPPSASKQNVVCFSRGENTFALRPAANVLQPYNRELPFAAAVHQGQLSLLLLNTFYAHKPSDTKTPQEEFFTQSAIAGTEVIVKMVKALETL